MNSPNVLSLFSSKGSRIKSATFGYNIYSSPFVGEKYNNKYTVFNYIVLPTSAGSYQKSSVVVSMYFYCSSYMKIFYTTCLTEALQQTCSSGLPPPGGAPRCHCRSLSQFSNVQVGGQRCRFKTQTTVHRTRIVATCELIRLFLWDIPSVNSNGTWVKVCQSYLAYFVCLYPVKYSVTNSCSW